MAAGFEPLRFSLFGGVAVKPVRSKLISKTHNYQRVAELPIRNAWRSEMFRLRPLVVLAALSTLLAGTTAYGEEKSIVVASTTSTADPALFRYILPLFKAQTAIDVNLAATGTGQPSATVRPAGA